MQEVGISFLLRQLGFYAPMLLVLAVGFILALSWMSRAPAAATLALAGVCILGATAVSVSVVQGYLIHALSASAHEMGTWMTVTAVASSLAHALGLGLLVAAVFAGRHPTRDQRPPLR